MRQSYRSVLVLATIATLTLVSNVRAGPLADLHVETARPEAAEHCDAPPGVECAPGVSGGPVAEAAPQIARLGYEAGPCGQGCPEFTVIFDAEGRFSYVGRANVERLGSHTGTVDMETLRRVMAYVAEIEFMELRDTYASGLLDGRSTYTLVETKGQTKVIMNQDGRAPATVWVLERLLLDLLEDADWAVE